MTELKRCVIATRESPLAMWQALHVQALLRNRYPEMDVQILGMTTKGLCPNTGAASRIW